MSIREWYQMDLFDLEDKEYQPIGRKLNPFAISTIYHCPKCDAVVGIYNEDDEVWGFEQKEVCKNGHKMKWRTKL